MGGVESDPQFAEEMEAYVEGDSGGEQQPAASSEEPASEVEAVSDQYDPVAYLRGKVEELNLAFEESQGKASRPIRDVLFGSKAAHEQKIKVKKEAQIAARDRARLEVAKTNNILTDLENGAPGAVEKASAWFTEQIDGLEKELGDLEQEIKEATHNCDEMARLEQGEETDYGVAEYRQLTDQIGVYRREIQALKDSGSEASSPKSGMSAGEMEIEIESLQRDQKKKGYGVQAHKLMDAQVQMNEVTTSKEELEMMRGNLARVVPEQQRGSAEVA